MKVDFSIPKKFEAYSDSFFEKEAITKREYVDFCLLAISLIDANWDKRQGIAYRLAGAWLKYKNISENDLLDQIGTEFGMLELPDHQAVGTQEGPEEKVRQKWQNVKQLVEEADKTFPAL